MLSSIRVKILLAFLLIVGVSFAVMATLLTQLVSDRLFEQRTRQDSLSVERLAVMAAPFFASAQMDDLQALLEDSAAEMGGRLLVLDKDGKVQADSFGLLYGTRLPLPEVVAVLVSGENLSYGIHQLDSAALSGTAEDYAAYYAAKLSVSGRTLGAVLYVSPVQALVDSLNTVRRQLWSVFLIVAAAALAVAFLFSRVITRPITALTKTIQKMGKGDLSARVKVRASGEMRDLADSYNAMAEEIEHFDQSRSQFVSNASHELKTPLTTMKILLENLIYQPDMPAELRGEFMQDMNHEIDRLTNVVTDLLTLTQTDSHETALRPERTDLSALIEEALHLLRPAAEKRGQALNAAIAPGLTVDCDPGKMKQIVTNLVDNALKYTPDGGKIAVSLADRGESVALTVTDDGVGIPEADQAHIFDRFYRVDKARSRATGGTGLGLAIVRQMVALHHGEITVTSAPGEGSTFTVTLPKRREEDA